MAETRRRGTRPDFKPGWEPFTLPEDEVLRRGGALFDAGMYWEAHEVWARSGACAPAGPTVTS
jgi:hypothetical protein